MALIKGFDMSHSPNMFQLGVAAFRNSREWAMTKRDQFIAVENVRMQKHGYDLCISPSFFSLSPVLKIWLTNSHGDEQKGLWS